MHASSLKAEKLFSRCQESRATQFNIMQYCHLLPITDAKAFVTTNLAMCVWACDSMLAGFYTGSKEVIAKEANFAEKSARQKLFHSLSQKVRSPTSLRLALLDNREIYRL